MGALKADDCVKLLKLISHLEGSYFHENISCFEYGFLCNNIDNTTLECFSFMNIFNVMIEIATCKIVRTNVASEISRPLVSINCMHLLCLDK